MNTSFVTHAEHEEIVKIKSLGCGEVVGLATLDWKVAGSNPCHSHLLCSAGAAAHFYTRLYLTQGQGHIFAIDHNT